MPRAELFAERQDRTGTGLRTPQRAGINRLAWGPRGTTLDSAHEMHELSIMKSALELALNEAERAGAERIYAIRLRIGVLSGVVPDALEFAFEVLVAGTSADGAKLVIESVPARFWCVACAREFESNDMLAECPDCRRPSGDLRAGREMEVASIEIESEKVLS